MLAQDWLTGGERRNPTPHDHILERHLALPDKFDPHTTPAVFNRIAERIVFTDDLPSILHNMHANKQITYRGMVTSAHLPFDCFWLEYKSVVGLSNKMGLEYANYGALVQRLGDEGVRLHIVIGFNVKDVPGPITTLAYVVDFDHWPPLMGTNHSGSETLMKFTLRFSITSVDNEAAGTFKIDERSLGGIVSEIIFGIFLVTQPKVYSEEKIEWDERKQRARAKAGKKPLLEYKKLRLRIAKEVVRYDHKGERNYNNATDTESDEAIRHRRYHKVMGHFRHLLQSIPPRTIWIEPHYRGDPALGVTFTERDVTR